jgi:hypothetical protein
MDKRLSTCATGTLFNVDHWLGLVLTPHLVATARHV